MQCKDIDVFYGDYSKKVVIADRVAPAANYLFNIHTNQGAVVILAAILCTIQLYMDFSGTVDISIGAAQIFGIHLPENFRQPFFAKKCNRFLASLAYYT